MAWQAGSVSAIRPLDLEDHRHVFSFAVRGGRHVSKSVLDAIREGDWFFEPEELDSGRFQATSAIPGTQQKVDVLAARARAGLPLWHQNDRVDYEQPEVR